MIEHLRDDEQITLPIATFNTPISDNLDTLQINIEPKQEFNGYDHPWVGGAGKNKLPTPIKGTYSSNGLTLTVDDKGVITVSGTTTSGGTVLVPLSQSYVIPSSVMQGGTGCMYLFNSFTTGQGNAFTMYYDNTRVETWQFTVANRKSDNWVGQAGKTINKIGVQFTSGQTYNGKFAPMFSEDGTTDATSFIPYSNICPIYPSNGKNLLPQFISGTSSGLTYTVNDDGSVHVTGTNTSTAFYAVRFTLNKGDYILSGAPVGGQLTIRNGLGGSAPPSEFSGTFDDYGVEAKFSVSDTATAWLNIRSVAGTYDTVYKPMIRPAEIENDEYVPYKGFGVTRTGKNLLDVEGRTVNAITYSPITIREEACTITKNGDVLSCATTGAWSKARLGLSPQFFVQGETYTISAHYENPNANTVGIALLDKASVWHTQPSSFSNATSVDIKLTTTIDTEYTQIGFVVNNTSSNPNSTVVISNIQVELGSAVTSYEPYQAEHGYSQGAQYLPLNSSDWTASTCTTTGYGASNTRFAPTTWIIPFKEGHTYTVDMEGSYESKVFNCGVNEYGSSGTRTRDFGWKTMPFTFTVDSGTTALRITFRASDDSNPTNYINAIGTQIKFKMTENGVSSPVVPFGKDVFGGTLDVVSGVLTVTHKCKNFDNYTGTITKSGSTTIPEGRIVWYIPAFSDSPNSGGDANPNHVTMKCSIYDIQDKPYQNNVLLATSFVMGIGRANGHAMVGFNMDNTYSTEELFRAWLQSAHCDIWYPLETPEVYQLTPQQIKTLIGTNNIWSDSGDILHVGYRAIAEPSDSDYGTDVLTPTEDKPYLWNYERIAFTDGTHADQEKHILAVYGSAGKSIQNVTEYYALSTGTTVPADSSFSTTVQIPTTTNKYVWNYEKITYTDKTEEYTEKRIIGVYGNTGATGATGNGIASVTVYYLLQASSTTPAVPTTDTPGGSWVTTEPSYTAGSTNYLFTVTKVKYTDGTFAYSAVSKSSSYEASKAAYNKAVSAETIANAAEKLVYHTCRSSGGTAGYFYFARFVVTYSYANKPITFTISNRGIYQTDVEIRMANLNGTDPAMQVFKKYGSANVYAVKADTSTWDLYVKKAESYDDATFTNFNLHGYESKFTWTWKDTTVTELPEGYRTAEDGTEIVTVTKQYYQHTSDTTAPGNVTWSDTVPTVDASKYLWTRDKVTYTTGEIRYTTAECITKYTSDIVAPDISTAISTANDYSAGLVTTERDARLEAVETITRNYDNLASTVSSNSTSIATNAQNIELRATKTEVTQLSTALAEVQQFRTTTTNYLTFDATRGLVMSATINGVKSPVESVINNSAWQLVTSGKVVQQVDANEGAQFSAIVLKALSANDIPTLTLGHLVISVQTNGTVIGKKA